MPELSTATAPFDLCPSSEHLVAVLFIKSRSPSYPAALGVARGADSYKEAASGSSTAHLAQFCSDPEQLSRAASLIRYVGEWKGAQIFISGRLANGKFGGASNIEQVLRCYAEACACQDPRAHCMVVSDHLYIDDRRTHEPVQVPCKHILRLFPMPLSAYHPSSNTDQLHARAVEAGCEWCPALYWNQKGEKGINT